MSNNQTAKSLFPDRQISNPTYLIIADDTEEFNTALRYASLAAKANGAHVGILYILPDGEFLPWGNVEEKMQQDRRQDAEKHLQGVADKVKEISGLTASLYVGEGNPPEAVLKAINDNSDIVKLILGASTKSGGPGPLVSFFMNKGVSKLPVPLTIIPDHISLQNTDAII